jgi:hypothetical protein
LAHKVGASQVIYMPILQGSHQPRWSKSHVDPPWLEQTMVCSPFQQCNISEVGRV